MNVLEQLRSYRVYDMAIFDLSAAVIGCEIIGRYWFNRKYIGGVLAVPIGLAVHRLVGVDTALGQKLNTNVGAYAGAAAGSNAGGNNRGEVITTQAPSMMPVMDSMFAPRTGEKLNGDAFIEHLNSSLYDWPF